METYSNEVTRDERQAACAPSHTWISASHFVRIYLKVRVGARKLDRGPSGGRALRERSGRVSKWKGAS